MGSRWAGHVQDTYRTRTENDSREIDKESVENRNEWKRGTTELRRRVSVKRYVERADVNSREREGMVENHNGWR